MKTKCLNRADIPKLRQKKCCDCGLKPVALYKLAKSDGMGGYVPDGYIYSNYSNYCIACEIKMGSGWRPTSVFQPPI